MIKRITAALSLLALLLASASSQAAYIPSPGLTIDPYFAFKVAGTVAVDFTSSANVAIDGVGIFNTYGLTESHTVTLTDLTTGLQVFTTTLGPNSVGTVSGNFLYVPMVEPSLIANHAYSLATVYVDNIDSTGYGPVKGVGPISPYDSTLNGGTFGGPLATGASLSISVPEPSSLILMGIGAIGVVAGGVARRKSVKASA